MPIRMFICENCGHEYEQLIRHDDVPTCKKCGETKDQKNILTSASFAFREPKITDISQVPPYRGKR